MSACLAAGILLSLSLAQADPVVIVPDAASVAEGTLSGAWRVQDGAIVGSAKAGETAWLRLAGEHRDFNVHLEFMTPTPANGGVQVRGHWLPANPPAGADPKTMYGYHVNINTAEGGRTGDVLVAHGEPPIGAATDDARNAIKAGDWNTLGVSANGPVMLVAVNGVPATVVFDEQSISGLIALQVAGGPDAPAEVRYRNIRIRPRDNAAEWLSLFDGNTLDGWEKFGSEEWTVENGTIQGRRGPKESEGYLATSEMYTDFRVRGEFRMLGDGNYGLFYHSTIALREDGYPVIAGVQGEVEPSYPGSSGWVYESYRRGWLVKPDPAMVQAFLLRPDEWNTIEIRSIGNRLTTWVNGFRVIEWLDPSPQLFSGSFALQLHTGEGAGIDWRNLFVTAP